MSSPPSDDSWLDRETLLDVTVNVVPMAILLFFVVLFVVVHPWQFDPFYAFLQHGLTIFPFAVLVLVTWVSAKYISRDETGDEVH